MPDKTEHELKKQVGESAAKAVYRFREIADPGDEVDRFVIREDNGDRCIIESLVFCTDWPIRPTRLVRKAEIEACPDLNS